jgi:hypothetical protein
MLTSGVVRPLTFFIERWIDLIGMIRIGPCYIILFSLTTEVNLL